MSGRILIVDDDIDFSALLADVFSQADYTVQVVNDPKTIEKVIQSASFDLLITDLRMPGRDGFEIVALMRQKQPSLPVIMVSGFLDQETRERMEAEGIVGIYEKPLSIFTLLKTAGKVIAAAAGGEPAPEEASAEDKKEAVRQNQLGFSFQSLPCASPASTKFAQDLNRQAMRRPNFCIVGEPGLPTTAIADDLTDWLDSEAEKSGCATIDALELKEEKVRTELERAAARDLLTLHLIILNADQLTPAQQNIVYQASKRESYTPDWSGSVRLIFFLGKDSEKLYADGVIGNSLYLLMGTQEIHIPPLRQCREDIEQIARDFFSEQNPPINLEAKALEILCSFDWPQNHSQLRKTLRELASAHAGSTISAEAAAMALAGASGTETGREIQRYTLRERLELARNDYLRATGILSGFLKN